ncbi:methylthioribulose 1-phosphate dehydratase [Aneurinibacillus sp. Ricciae_BoGa-3]|uniref:methylthioribulose 1-phosphate dehydratase n=1 Tax=Aneurinibacillus sp. Ricciae_BoGa-3 TaxID=3022697 RepID=UPI0023406F11|nr:methylthioribulose 1-phosphate dehydratase [Aneurinibacillus sp. Ricciae_BoGa-3]WCK55650.1 methylthioribulose 1-phosphate dehydratase [Aneurinibacillus sp. Ricciae_BoGa-3]
MRIESIQQAFDTLRNVKSDFARRDWFPGTSGNLSVRVEEAVAITASGKDKAASTPEDFLLVDLTGRPVTPTHLKPSAETLVHTVIYNKVLESQAVFHVHTVANNLVSELYGDDRGVTFQGQELIKAFNIWEENASITIPIVENFAHIPTLAEEIGKVLDPRVPGVLIRNHGIYVWGDSAFAAKRHLEAFEFLFDYHIKLQLLRK